MNKKIAIPFAIAAVSIIGLSSVLAAEQINYNGRNDNGLQMRNKPLYVGKITAISGNTITIQSHSKDRSEVTYTVDASSAKISKGFGSDTQTISITDIVAGESIAVEGTLSGTNIAATTISYGMPERGNRGNHN